MMTDKDRNNIRVQTQYSTNKQASVGENIKCPICGKVFTKKQYSQAFCCIECKNDYWNLKRGKQQTEIKYTSNVIG